MTRPGESRAWGRTVIRRLHAVANGQVVRYTDAGVETYAQVTGQLPDGTVAVAVMDSTQLGGLRPESLPYCPEFVPTTEAAS